ncbi:GIY-YIG nuclease family protein [Microbacterium luteum]|jgi:putative endonuclease|uniref:GIY-YIG nuclease family protein n=1 Tax=Microbacterium TaxID=33882 RepID=UPI0018882F7C|nr:GIY-YIG nuclease family protein [Microbacterium luteum]|tara:strand:- start:232 stop:555 length:324 start_codon:yes stop_codon:yes gene_type:complete
MPYMYILECADRSFYVGSTRDLDLRVAQHNFGEGAEYTFHRRPVRLVYFEEYERMDDAFLREKQVQGWGRAKRIALITGHVSALSALSKKSRFAGRDAAGEQEVAGA